MQLRPENKGTEAFATDMDVELLLAQNGELQIQYDTAVRYLESLRTKINEQKTNYQNTYSEEVAACFRLLEQVQRLLTEAGLPAVKSHFASINIRISTYNLQCANYREAQYQVQKSREYQRLIKTARVIKKDARSVKANITQISSYASTLDLMNKRFEQVLDNLQFISEPIQQSKIIVNDVIANIIVLEEQAKTLKSALNNSNNVNTRLNPLNELEMSLADRKRQIVALQRQIELTAATVNQDIGFYQAHLYEYFSSLSVKIKLIRKDVASVIERFLSLPHTLEMIIEP